jgi:hypothetical protein
LKQLILNTAALASVVGTAQRIRVRVANMGDYLELQIRPTDRASAVNLPKGETLADIGEGGIVELPDEAVTAMGDATYLVVQPRKHGWQALVNAVRSHDEAPVAQVS